MPDEEDWLYYEIDLLLFLQTHLFQQPPPRLLAYFTRECTHRELQQHNSVTVRLAFFWLEYNERRLGFIC